MQSKNTKVNHTEQRREKQPSSLKKKRVCFSEEPDDICYNNDAPLTNEEINTVWYSKYDEIRMKYEVKTLARNLRPMLTRSSLCTQLLRHDDMAENGRLPPQSLAIKENAYNESSRGLEYRIFLKRQMKKILATRTILECQRKIKASIAIATKNGDPKRQSMVTIGHIKLGIISEKCTRWSRDVASMTGKFDFEIAYDNVQVSPQKSLNGRFPLKRKFLDETVTSSEQRKKLIKLPHFNGKLHSSPQCAY